MNNFTYFQPKTLQEAGEMFGKSWHETTALAGGTDLLGLMKDDIEAPRNVVNLKSLPGLNRISYQPGKGLKIGALTSIAKIASHSDINKRYPVLAQAAKQVASPQLRNVGTIGGNICQRPRCWYFRGDFHCLRKGGDICYAVDGKNKYHCVIGGGPCFIVHPSDMAVALLALDAKLTVYSGGKNKTVAIGDFFVLPEKNVRRENILLPGEIVVDIRIQELNNNTKSGYVKFAERGVWDFAVVSVAAVIQKNGNALKKGRVVLGGVAPAPWFEKKISKKLSGLIPSEKNLDEIMKTALVDAEPLAMNEYKLPLAKNLMKRLIGELTA